MSTQPENQVAKDHAEAHTPRKRAPRERRRQPVEHPVTRCSEYGPRTLSLSECIAVVVGETGGEGVRRFSSPAVTLAVSEIAFPAEEGERALFRSLETLVTGDAPELLGLAPTQSSRLLAAFEIARRYHAWVEAETRASQRASRIRSEAVEAGLAAIPDRLRADTHEWLGFVPVYAGGRAGRLCVAAHGTRTHVNVDPADLFARILALRPQAILLVHNHPSGLVTPSAEDRSLSRSVDEVLSRVGIQFLGHWVVTAGEEAEVP